MTKATDLNPGEHRAYDGLWRTLLARIWPDGDWVVEFVDHWQQPIGERTRIRRESQKKAVEAVNAHVGAGVARTLKWEPELDN